MIDERWAEELERCVEGLYVVDEESRQIVWTNDFFSRAGRPAGTGEPCWRVLLGRERPCPFCPKLSEEDGVYSWELFDPSRGSWMKIKQCVFRRGGKRYRAGNVNLIDEEMQLNRDTVEEISSLRTNLEENRGELMNLRRDALHDKLTGLFDRNRYLKELENAPMAPAAFGVLYLDLNNLKETNDRFGHQAGDELLRGLSRAMHRAGETAGGAECYRLGGDEFLMTFRGCTEEGLKACAEGLNTLLQEEIAGCGFTASAAVGRAFSPVPCPLEKLVRSADEDMYGVKQRQKAAARSAPPRDPPQDG